ncbi:MAG TPA: GMC oxidoreductase [Gemmatimonadaceae bacterium]|nr:GMC oxidoreductase [Gemmatimonadaceae bacterium]
MKTLFILNDPPYGTERSYNALRLAGDVPNLFICDGSVFPSGTGVNPSLTIEAIAARTADGITDIVRRREI